MQLSQEAGQEGNHKPSKEQTSGGAKRVLNSRQIQMIAVGGTIGTGLYIQTGTMLSQNGAVGSIISYVVGITLVYSVMTALAEMATLFPSTGSFNSHAERFVDPALGFLSGWNYCLGWLVNLPLQAQAIQRVMTFWVPNVPIWVWMVAFVILYTAVCFFFNFRSTFLQSKSLERLNMFCQ
jgi:amino acid permease